MERLKKYLWLPVTLALFATLLGWLFLFPKQYYLAAALLILEAIGLWLIYLENSRPKAQELAIMAALSALGIAGRALFFLIPQVKPTAAIVFISGLTLGPAPGFTVGLLSMFLSNFIFGQSINTPFQMLGMGLVGFLAGLIAPDRVRRSRKIQLISAFLSVFFVYGLIVDSGSVLFLYRWQGKLAIVSTYLAGIPFNLAHAASTAVFLYFLSPLLCPQLGRISLKYGLFKYRMIE